MKTKHQQYRDTMLSSNGIKDLDFVKTFFYVVLSWITSRNFWLQTFHPVIKNEMRFSEYMIINVIHTVMQIINSDVFNNARKLTQ